LKAVQIIVLRPYARFVYSINSVKQIAYTVIDCNSIINGANIITLNQGGQTVNIFDECVHEL